MQTHHGDDAGNIGVRNPRHSCDWQPFAEICLGCGASANKVLQLEDFANEEGFAMYRSQLRSLSAQMRALERAQQQERQEFLNASAAD